MLVLHRWHLTDIDTLSPLEELDPFKTYLNGIHPTWIHVQPFVHIHSLFGCQRLYHQRQNRHWPSLKCDWQTISITLFMPPFTHQTCHLFQFSSQTPPNLLSRRYQTIYRRMKATTQKSPQQTPQTRQLTSLPTYQKMFLTDHHDANYISFMSLRKKATISNTSRKKGISFQNNGQNNLIVLPLFDHPCFSSFLLILVTIYPQDEWDSKLK